MKINMDLQKGWLTAELKNDIRQVFEPRYHRLLTEQEVVEIAENLAGMVEQACKYQWKKIYEKIEV